MAYITLDRPEKLNALNSHMEQALHEAWLAAEADADVWVIILSGTGGAFCVGSDIHEQLADASPRLSFGGGLTGVNGQRVHVTKPVIAAVDGYALGGGFELAMSCDIIVATTAAKFGLPEARVGMITGSPVVHRVVRQLPYHVAMGLLLTGESLTGERAFHCGLVNELATAETLIDESRDWARRILRCSPQGVRAMKEAAVSRLGWPLDIALTTRFDSIEEYQASSDRQEGIAAFREKRHPTWTGR